MPSKKEAPDYSFERLEFLEDESGLWKIEDVTSLPLVSQFREIGHRPLGFMGTPSWCWLRFHLTPAREKEQRVLVLEQTLWDRVELYLPDKQGGYLMIPDGLTHREKKRRRPPRQYIFDIEPEPTPDTFVYLRLAGRSQWYLTMKVHSKTGLKRYRHREHYVFGAFFGILLMMGIYNLFVYFSSRKKAYLYYVLFLTCLGAFFFYENGFAHQFAWMNSAQWRSQAQVFWGALIGIFAIQFSRNFLDFASFTPRLIPMAQIFLVFFGMVGFAALFNSSALEQSLFWSINLSLPLMSLFLVFCGTVSLVNGNRTGRLFIAAWLVYAFFIFMRSAALFGLIGFKAWITYGFQTATIIEMLLLSLALADRINLLQDQRDGSRRKESEERVLRYQAEEAERAKGRFLARMSHEIRTPMNGVLGMAELLLGTELTQRQRKYAEVVHGSGSLLLRIINDILDYSKIEAGKLELENNPFDLHRLIEDLLHMVVTNAEEKGLELVQHIHRDVPRYLKGDQVRMGQILLNLLGNAIKFTEGGEVFLEIRMLEQDVSSVRLCITVRDTGIGIDQDTQNFLFEPFSQAESSITRRFGGTGLGLAIAKQIVQKMGGEIGVESHVAKGSNFWFIINLEKQKREQYTDAHREHLKGKKVLVVDDNATNRALFKEELNLWGIEATTASDGRDALNILRETSANSNYFDAAILDYHLPDLNGVKLAQTIKDDPRILELPLILLTSSMTAESREELERLNICIHAAKPISLTRLNLYLNTVFEERAMESIKLKLAVEGSFPHPNQLENTFEDLRVLVAEDNRVNQMVIRGMLNRLGCEAHIFENGQLALEAWRSADFDLILMDCEMPVLDGLEATITIREEEVKERIPIIALTAHAQKEKLDQCYLSGMDDTLVKPLSKQRLAKMLAKWAFPEKRPPSVSAEAEESREPIQD